MSLNVYKKESIKNTKRVSSQTKKINTTISAISQNKKEISSINNNIVLIQEKIKNLKLLVNNVPKFEKKKVGKINQINGKYNLKALTLNTTKIKSFSIENTKKNDLYKTPRLTQTNSKVLSKKNSVERDCKTNFEIGKTEKLIKNHSIEINLNAPMIKTITPIKFYGTFYKNTHLTKKPILTKKSKIDLKQNTSLEKEYFNKANFIKEKLESIKNKMTSLEWTQIKCFSQRENKKEKNKNKVELNKKTGLILMHNQAKQRKLANKINLLKKSEIKDQTISINSFKNQNFSNKSLITKEDFTRIKIDDEFSNISTSNITTNNSIKQLKKIREIYEISRTGLARNNQEKVNQDSCFIYKNFSLGEDSIFMGVCDGHGPIGHEVSKFVKVRLPEFLNSEINICFSQKGSINLNRIIEETFLQTNDEIFMEINNDINFSGSTCCSLIYTPEKLICANLGDSRCILGRHVNNLWKFQSLSRDHKPNERDESERILSKNGRVEPYQDFDGTFVGPMRVWIQEDSIPGLAMSRSFGDKIASTVGVIPLPEIKEWKFTNEDKFIIIASDGIWEFIDNQECVNIVKDFYLKNDIVGACEFLVEEATRYWIKEDTIIDDITVIIVFLDN